MALSEQFPQVLKDIITLFLAILFFLLIFTEEENDLPFNNKHIWFLKKSKLSTHEKTLCFIIKYQTFGKHIKIYSFVPSKDYWILVGAAILENQMLTTRYTFLDSVAASFCLLPEFKLGELTWTLELWYKTWDIRIWIVTLSALGFHQPWSKRRIYQSTVSL